MTIPPGFSFPLDRSEGYEGLTTVRKKWNWIKDKFTIGPFSSVTNLLVFEGGTVIKFARYNHSTLVYPGLNTDCRAEFRGSMYRPVLLVSEDDPVGEKLTTNSPSGYYAYEALLLRSWSESRKFDLPWVRITRAINPINIGGGSGHTLRHFQSVNNYYGMSGSYNDISVYNGLFASLDGGFFDGYTNSTAIRVEHGTIKDIAEWLAWGTKPVFVNSLIAGVPTGCCPPYTPGQYPLWVGTADLASTNLVDSYVEPSSAGLFASALQGGSYLPLDSPYRNQGGTAINHQLAADLRVLTTEAPIQLVGPITTDLSLIHI
jgi:hypothetical protein